MNLKTKRSEWKYVKTQNTDECLKKDWYVGNVQT